MTGIPLRIKKRIWIKKQEASERCQDHPPQWHPSFSKSAGTGYYWCYRMTCMGSFHSFPTCLNFPYLPHKVCKLWSFQKGHTHTHTHLFCYVRTKKKKVVISPISKPLNLFVYPWFQESCMSCFGIDVIYSVLDAMIPLGTSFTSLEELQDLSRCRIQMISRSYLVLGRHWWISTALVRI